MPTALVLAVALGTAAAETDDKPLNLLLLPPETTLPAWMDGSYTPMTARMERAERWHDVGIVGMRAGGAIAVVGIAGVVTGTVVDAPTVADFGIVTTALGGSVAVASLGVSAVGTTQAANAVRDSGVPVARTVGWVALGGWAAAQVGGPLLAGTPAAEPLILAGGITVVGAGAVQVVRGRNLFDVYHVQKPTKAHAFELDVVPVLQRDHKGVRLAARF